LRGTSTIAASVPNVVATAMSFNTTRIISSPGTTQLHQKETQCIDSQPWQKNNLICYCLEKFHLSCSPTIQLLRAQSLLWRGNTVILYLNMTFLVQSWLFCIQHLSCFSKFRCILGGSVEVWLKIIL
jgi:hypothetical protein